VAGCPAQKEALVPVTGTITVKKQPLAHGTVVFRPDLQKGNKDKREPRATIASELPGVYRLTTDGQEGAPSGWYTVTVYSLKPAMSNASPPVWLAAQRYTDEKTSGLSVEVVKEAPLGTYDFDLDPPR
jgi:hypothetical protein